MMNNLVDRYIENQKSPQKEILREVREIFIKTLPDLEEKKLVELIKLVDEKTKCVSC